MQQTIDVQTGEVRAEQGEVVLQSNAIGSCVVIVAHDAAKNIGAIAHIMLPGSAPANKKPAEKTKYAANSIVAIVSQMGRLGSKKEDIEVALVGAGNVLNRKDDTICKDNIESTLELLRKKHLKVSAQAVGGTNRRSVRLDVERGIVSYTEGNGAETQLWRTQKVTE